VTDANTYETLLQRLNSPRLRHALAVMAGLLLAAAFPNPSIAGFAWIAPGLMLAAAFGQRGAECFRVGYVAGLAFWLASLYWLCLIPVTGLPILGWVLLAAYNALFQGTWVWLCWKCFPVSPRSRRRQESPSEPEPGTRTTATVSQSLLTPAATILETPRLSRLRWALLCAALWVALEMLRSRFLSGFPWSLLGVSQFQMPPLLQISSFTGVYGVSFLVAWTSVSLFCAGAALLGRRRVETEALNEPKPFRPPSFVSVELIAPLLVVAVVFAIGYHRITHAPEATRTLRLTSIQPSIPQTAIWDRAQNEQRFADLLALSERALTNPTDVLLWPEAALPELNEASFIALTNLAVRHNVAFIFGADDVQPRPGATREDDLQWFNSAWLLSPRGYVADTYHKRRLVIFGEYIPLVKVLPFLKWFTTITGNFTAGREPAQFPLREAGIIAAPLICFEDVFPHGAREHVNEQTDLLVNLTNDGWFGEGAEQWQHAANSVFRAIENGRPLVRSCNNGLTCWVDEFGRIRQPFRDERGSIYGPGFATFTVPLQTAPHSRTFYNRHGDVFGWACVVMAGLAVASRGLRRRN
jgi:apolipoprotein N-acyltransferase